MSIFNFLMKRVYEPSIDTNSVLFIIFAGCIMFPIKFFMKNRWDSYFEEKRASVKAELGPPKYRINSEVNVLTRHLVTESFLIICIYLDSYKKTYVYDLKDVADDTIYESVPEHHLCPLVPQRFAVNKTSFTDLMLSLSSGHRDRHDMPS